jgi:hypothetical protein
MEKPAFMHKSMKLSMPLISVLFLMYGGNYSTLAGIFLKKAPTEGWYDLMASKQGKPLFCHCTRVVPRKHWRRLGRALVSQDNYSGMASWTGTMFGVPYAQSSSSLL